MTILKELDARVATSGGATGVVFPDQRVTWSELRERSDQVASALHAVGVRPGQNVGIMLPNCLENLIALVGVMRAGATAVPFNLRSREHELAHLVKDSEIVALLLGDTADQSWSANAAIPSVLPELAAQEPGQAATAAAPMLRNVVTMVGDAVPGSFPREDFLSLAESVPVTAADPDPESTAIIMYTSGTTASPKGAMISHRALLAQAHAVGEVAFGLTSDDRFWTPLPLFHTGGIVPFMACIATGAQYTHVGVHEPGLALEQLERERITVAMPVFEPIWLPVLEHPRFDDTDLSHLRIVQTAGLPETQRRMQARFPHATNMQSSGMTETTSYFAINRPEDPEDIRLVTGGYPLPTFEVLIVDPETGEPVGAGQRGETQLRGEGMFSGYYNQPELTAAVHTEGGWFRTGDMGVLDEAGRYTWQGRYKDMMKVGGENVSAAEVENYLAGHPAVALAQVVGAPDERYVEVPAAFVQLRPGAAATEQEIIDFCIGRIASYRVPRYVRFVDEWPMSGTKIQKFRLRERIADELRAAGIRSAEKVATATILTPRARSR